MCAVRAIFQDPVAGASFPAFFADAVAEAGRDLAVARATDGDLALLIDPNPRQAVKAALSLRQRLQRSDYACDIRFGGDAGFVELGGGVRARRPEPGCAAGGGTARTARTAGTILVTGQFVEARRNLLGAGRLRARPVEPGEVPLCGKATGASIRRRAGRRRCCGGWSCWTARGSIG